MKERSTGNARCGSANGVIMWQPQNKVGGNMFASDYRSFIVLSVVISLTLNKVYRSTKKLFIRNKSGIAHIYLITVMTYIPIPP
jgi:hypothetical protein